MLMDPSKGKQEVITPNNQVHWHQLPSDLPCHLPCNLPSECQKNQPLPGELPCLDDRSAAGWGCWKVCFVTGDGPCHLLFNTKQGKGRGMESFAEDAGSC